jgi:pectinesterase
MMKKLSIFIFLLTLMLGLQAQQLPLKFTVAQDNSGDFKTIQEAVNKVRDHSQQVVTIFIKNGIYKEKLVIPSWKKNIALIGENKEKTIITNDDYSGKDFPNKDFTGNTKYSTYTSYTILMQANDCRIENITIQNTAGRVGQAVALMIEADRCLVKNCNILGNQDTLYTAKDGRNYFKDCHIEGTTDFIFGEATVVFENCTIKSLQNSYITAASTTKEQAFGFVFLNCKLIAADGIDKVYLGRPWRPFAKTVFMNTEIAAHIKPVGWDPWKGDAMFPDKEKTVFYAEYQNFGPGAAISTRVKWARQLTSAEAKKYNLKNIFKDWISK